MDLHKIKALAFDLFGDKRSVQSGERGEKYYHGERTAKLALKLRTLIFPNDSSYDDIITVAAWFHDILNGEKDHNTEGAKIVYEILAPHCTEYELKEICGIISVHDDRSHLKSYPPHIKLHQDADHLDHFGVFDVWRTFIYAIPHDQTILDILEWMTKIRPLENERYRFELNYELSRKIFDEKMCFLKDFTDRFNVESAGGIWNGESLTLQ